MTTEIPLGIQGLNYPWQCQKHMETSSIMTSQRKPLRHSIDAILHKTPPSSPSSNGSASPKAVLPHIETLRRHDVVSTSLFQVTKPTCDVDMTRCVARFDDGDDSRADPSSQSSFDSGEELDDVVVVDETTNDEDAVSMDEETAENSHEALKAFESLVPSSTPQIQSPTVSSQSWDLSSNALPFNQHKHSNKANQKAQQQHFTDKAKNGFKTNLNTEVDSVDTVKSAFRPIVRPWLAGVGSKKAANKAPPPPAVVKDQFRAVGTMQAKPGLSSLDAISMLRRQSSAFRVACGNTNSSRINGGRPHHVHTAVSSSRLQNGVDVGQPLPSSLASWFSWLRAGGAHYGGQPSSQQFPPGMVPCRGVLPPSNPVPAPATHHQQAPRYNCEACGKSYSTFGGLSKHKQFHCSAQIKKDFRCKYCDKSYSSLGALKMHIRTHTLPCKCNVCGKAFSRPWLLQGHLRTHTGEKPFSCQHCARAFADRSNLRAHLQTHSDVKKYSCRHCSKTFSRMSLLVKHRDSSCVALHR